MSYIYCAGPLFNPAERDEMAAIAAALEAADHTTFLPHRDGLEFAKLQPLLIQQGLSAAEAASVLEKAIFALDVHLVLNEADAVVANLNGRVPDEGMIVEVTLAWLKGKPLVFYKSDDRSLLHGADNPLLRGLTDFEVVASIPELPDAVQRTLEGGSASTWQEASNMGATIQQLRRQHSDPVVLAAGLVKTLK